MRSMSYCQQLFVIFSVVFLPQSCITATNWSGRRGSNSRHLPWQGSALPTELRPHKNKTPECLVPGP